MGALFCRRKPRVRLEAQCTAAGMTGLRSGTCADASDVGMGEAFRLARKKWRPTTNVFACCATTVGGHSKPSKYS